MFSRLTVVFLLFVAASAIYDHRPAERYQTFLPTLSPSQLFQLKSLIYDQSKTKGQTLEAVKMWLKNQSPMAQYNFIRSQLVYRRKDDSRNSALDAIENQVSPQAKHRIYDDMNISDRQTCESVSAVIRGAGQSVREELSIEPMDCAAVFASLAH
ncbi:hypothetical protein M3Y98_00965500 [Aphelenchoides besseyi]|nr:hypothetical protein M3Y98_00965500 [Aphelenchoides besseyi]KAI6194730.1 hypothetical protein M3Y96_01155600 [Aphelenchoides besseyi]